MASSSPHGNGVTGGDQVTGQAVPVIRHNLPQVPTLTQHPRMAMSKTNSHSVSTDDHPPQYANIVPMETVCQGQTLATNTQPLLVTPTPPSDGTTVTCDSPSVKLHSACPSQSAPIPSPPIKLRIRRSFHEGTLCSHSTPTPTTQTHEQMAASTVCVPMHPVAPPLSVATGFPPTRFGRAKTKGDIKKQLMEKKRDRKMQEASRDAAIKQEALVRALHITLTTSQTSSCGIVIFMINAIPLVLPISAAHFSITAFVTSRQSDWVYFLS